MSKVGPKELQRRALAESVFKPKRAVVATSPTPARSTPSAEGGVPIDSASALRSGQLSAPVFQSGPGSSKAGAALIAPPGQCTYCDARRERVNAAVRLHRATKARKAKEKPT